MEFDFIKKYKIEIFLIITACFISIISLLIYIKSGSSDEIDIIEKNNSSIDKKGSDIVVDVSGAVNKPGIYKLEFGSRINDAIKKAEGLSEEADKNYFARNFNLSSYLFNQEKIHVPHMWEINSGIFTEETRILNYLSPFVENEDNVFETSYETSLINVNTATSKELEELAGIGQVTAQKIIDNRPFSSVEELLTKKVLKQNIFDNIKDQIIAK